MKELYDLIKLATGYDILDDAPKRVTFTEVSLRRSAAEHAWHRTGESKHVAVMRNCERLLKEMMEKSGDSLYIELRPSELSKLLNAH